MRESDHWKSGMRQVFVTGAGWASSQFLSTAHSVESLAAQLGETTVWLGHAIRALALTEGSRPDLAVDCRRAPGSELHLAMVAVGPLGRGVGSPPVLGEAFPRALAVGYRQVPGADYRPVRAVVSRLAVRDTTPPTFRHGPASFWNWRDEE